METEIKAKIETKETSEVETKYVFRKATVHDTGAMKELIEMFHDEYLNDLGFSMSDLLFQKIATSDILSSTWVACLPNEMIEAVYDHNGKLVAEADIRHGKVVGIFSGYYTTYILNNDKMFHEIVWYVNPDYRKGCGKALYNHCVNQIKLSGTKKLVMIHMSTDKSGTLEKLYKSLGFTSLETHYVKDL